MIANIKKILKENIVKIIKKIRKGRYICKKKINQIIGRELWYRVQFKCSKIFLGTESAGWTICPDKITRDSIGTVLFILLVLGKIFPSILL